MSSLLHELILLLRQAEMRADLKLHLVHIAGTRMIAQGTDGLSRGMLCEGVMAGHDMLDYVDIARMALSWHPELGNKFVRAWTGVHDLAPLREDKWFDVGHCIAGRNLNAHGIWIPYHIPKGWIDW